MIAAILFYIDAIAFFVFYFLYFLFLLAAYCYLNQYKSFKPKEEEEITVLDKRLDNLQDGQQAKSSMKIAKNDIPSFINRTLVKQVNLR